LAWSPRQRSQVLGIDRANQAQVMNDDHARSSQIGAASFEAELTNSAEGEVWVTGEGPIGTEFSSIHGQHGGEGLVSWVRLSPQKVRSHSCSLASIHSYNCMIVPQSLQDAPATRRDAECVCRNVGACRVVAHTARREKSSE
jgi:hypothetical protein